MGNDILNSPATNELEQLEQFIDANLYINSQITCMLKIVSKNIRNSDSI